MKKYAITIAVVLFDVCAIAFSATNELSGAHAENELSCSDCHGTDEPAKKNWTISM